MSAQDLHVAIRSRVKTQVEDTESVYVLYDNAPDLHPDDSVWVRAHIEVGGTVQIQAGPVAADRTVGFLMMLVHQPIEQGNKTALELADIIATAFKRKTADGVRYWVPTIRTGSPPREDDGKWWVTVVACPFQCEVSE